MKFCENDHYNKNKNKNNDNTEIEEMKSLPQKPHILEHETSKIGKSCRRSKKKRCNKKGKKDLAQSSSIGWRSFDFFLLIIFVVAVVAVVVIEYSLDDVRSLCGLFCYYIRRPNNTKKKWNKEKNNYNPA